MKKKHSFEPFPGEYASNGLEFRLRGTRDRTIKKSTNNNNSRSKFKNLSSLSADGNLFEIFFIIFVRSNKVCIGSVLGVYSRLEWARLMENLPRRVFPRMIGEGEGGGCGMVGFCGK